MIYTFWKEFKALIKFHSLLKKGKINEAALAYKSFTELSNDVEKQIADKIIEAKLTFKEHAVAVATLKSELKL